MTYITITNNLTGQEFHYYVEVVNYTQMYSRLRVIMRQLAIIEHINPANLSYNIESPLLAA